MARPGKGKRGKPSTLPKGQRALATRVKSAKGRTVSSKRWLERQLNDPYVAAARASGYRSRAAYKLAEIDAKHKLLRPGMRVLDLGATPGGWSQVAAAKVKAGEPGGGQVLAADINPMDPIPDVVFMQLDFFEAGAEERIKAALGGKADVVLSDMAAPATGHKMTDHLRIMALCEAVAAFAVTILAEDGVLLCKVLQGGTEGELLATMKQHFKTVRHVKPPASRSDSSELYVLATGFRG
jgi:23S rRNA (uridine2552-2'-O)-methyltransferase